MKYSKEYLEIAIINQGKVLATCAIPVGSGILMHTTLLNFENNPDENSHYLITHSLKQ